MSTVAAVKPATTLPGADYDRFFYTGMAIVMALTVFIGFAPTFYLRTFFGSPVSPTGAVTLSPLAQVHGAVFSLWVVLFIVQTALVANRRVAVHRTLGYAGAGLAALMVILGSLTAIRAAARGSAPPGMDSRTFLAIPAFDMVLFAGFIIAAMRARRDKEKHKRLMLMAYISIIVAAVARIPGVLPLGPPGFFGFTAIFILIGIAYDWYSRRRIHPVYLWGGGIFVLSVPLRLMIAGTAPWHRLADFLIRL